MSEQAAPYVPDEATRRCLQENLLAAAAELRKSSEELQEIQQMLDRDYEQSPIGQLHARWAEEKARPANGNTP